MGKGGEEGEAPSVGKGGGEEIEEEEGSESDMVRTNKSRHKPKRKKTQKREKEEVSVKKTNNRNEKDRFDKKFNHNHPRVRDTEGATFDCVIVNLSSILIHSFSPAEHQWPLAVAWREAGWWFDCHSVTLT